MPSWTFWHYHYHPYHLCCHQQQQEQHEQINNNTCGHVVLSFCQVSSVATFKCGHMVFLAAFKQFVPPLASHSLTIWTMSIYGMEHEGGSSLNALCLYISLSLSFFTKATIKSSFIFKFKA